MTACDACLARTWLLARLAGHIDQHRNRVGPLLALDDQELIAAVGGGQRAAIEAEYNGLDPSASREGAARADLEQVCRCQESYPAGLTELEAPPAVLHVLGRRDRFAEVLDQQAVAIVGARRASPYGLDTARALGRGVAASGLTVVSGLALGIDGAAHRGALEVEGPTVAVLAGAAELPYPTSARRLHARVREQGVVVSELPPGTRSRRWMFLARNRIIAALSALTVVVEARYASGALVTARAAGALRRRVGAVPGRITSPLAQGPHQLIRDGAMVVTGPEDILEALLGPRARERPARRTAPLAPESHALLDALAEGHGTAEALARAEIPAEQGLAALASLELLGLVRREAGGRYSVPP